MKRLLRCSLLALATAFGPAAATALAQQPAQEERIAALVNDEVVSYSDVMGRLRLATASAGVPDTPEARQRLLPQVLRVLIEERLQIQEARRLELAVTDAEVEREIADLARRNNMNSSAFAQALAQQGIPLSTLQTQTRAGIAWGRIVQRRLRPTASVAEEEVANRIEQIRANVGKPEYLVSEIFLSVDDPASEGEVRRLADRLVEQIAAGANFNAVAQQFSQSAAAATGGEVGWILPGQLETELDRALQQLKPGQFSRPIRSNSGFHIFWLRDQRTIVAGDPNDIRVAVGQFVLPVPAGVDPSVPLRQAEQITQEASSCAALEAAAGGIPGAQIAGLPLTRLGDIPEEIRSLVAPLGVGTPSRPLMTDVGVMVFMICAREVPEGSTPPADQIRNALLMERLDMLQRRYLRDLRKSATVEVRL